MADPAGRPARRRGGPRRTRPGGLPGPAARPAADGRAAHVVRPRRATRRPGGTPNTTRSSDRHCGSSTTIPDHPWTVANLAAAVGNSRAVFARRFTDRVGEPPIAFLTGWRLALAADLLRSGDATIAAVARQVGYGTPFALSSAFKRAYGVSPNAYRARRRRAEPRFAANTPATEVAAMVTSAPEHQRRRLARPQQVLLGAERGRRDGHAELRGRQHAPAAAAARAPCRRRAPGSPRHRARRRAR